MAATIQGQGVGSRHLWPPTDTGCGGGAIYPLYLTIMPVLLHQAHEPLSTTRSLTLVYSLRSVWATGVRSSGAPSPTASAKQLAQ